MHNLGQHHAKLPNVFIHRDDVCNNFLLVDVFADVDALFVAYLDVADVQAIYDVLHGIRVAAGGCSEGEYAEMWVLRHHEAYDLGVGIITRALVRLICEPSQLHRHKTAAADAPTTIRTISVGSHVLDMRSLRSVCGVM